MHTGFYLSFTFNDFLFKGVDVNSKWGMVQLCFGIAASSMFLEVLKSGLSMCVRPYNRISKGSSKTPSLSHFELQTRVNGIQHSWLYNIKRLCYRVLGSLLYAGILTLNFMVMLSVMTFNGYFTIAAILGYGLGYLFFGFLRMPSTLISFHHSVKVIHSCYDILTDRRRDDNDDDAILQSDKYDECELNLDRNVNEETVSRSISNNAKSERLPSSQITVVEAEVYPR